MKTVILSLYFLIFFYVSVSVAQPSLRINLSNGKYRIIDDSKTKTLKDSDGILSIKYHCPFIFEFEGLGDNQHITINKKEVELVYPEAKKADEGAEESTKGFDNLKPCKENLLSLYEIYNQFWAVKDSSLKAKETLLASTSYNATRRELKVYITSDSILKCDCSKEELITAKRYIEEIQMVMGYSSFFPNTGISYYNMPRAEGDEILYNIAIKEGEKVVREIPIAAKVRGQLKINTSMGVACVLGLNDDSYHIKGEKGDSSLLVKNTNNNVFQPLTLNALTHFYRQSGGFVNVGACAGLGLAIRESDLKGSFLFGGSLLLGEQQRFILNLGVVGASKKVLKPEFNTTDKYITSSLPTADNLTASAFRLGGFVGITWNLSSEKKIINQ